MPKEDAHPARAQSTRRDLRSVLAQDAIIKTSLSEGELDRLFTPANYLGVADQFIDRVLASSTVHREQKKNRKK